MKGTEGRRHRANLLQRGILTLIDGRLCPQVQLTVGPMNARDFINDFQSRVLNLPGCEVHPLDFRFEFPPTSDSGSANERKPDLVILDRNDRFI